MTHDEKLELARELSRRLLARHGEDAIVAIGLHGPLARGDDTGDAGLDLAVITAGPEVAVPERSLQHRGIVVDLGAIWADAYLEEAGHIGPTWPLAADQYVHHLALHDPGGFFHKLRHVHQTALDGAADEVFAAAAGYDLVQLLSWEARARSAELHGDVPGALLAVKEAAVLCALVVGLATRTSYRDAANAIRSAALAEAAPAGFADPYRRLLSPATDPASAVIALGRAAAALTAFARREGIPFEAEDLDTFL
ncbi:MAG TPA: hypothetical protein VG276_27365 [Actinomycetes bacterium]|nr:hypothetical protein [Actinomycetes bacterium]